MCTEKGLTLASTLLSHVNFIKLPYMLLDSKDHCNFCLAISKTIVYNEMESIRKSALNIYQTYLCSFETRGFYLLVNNLMTILNHTGLIGYTITLYKNHIAEEFSEKMNKTCLFIVKDQKFIQLLKKFCHLHKNEESDLIELCDQIIATLNLLRYLALRDKNNVTGSWEYLKSLENTYFKYLRKGIDLSRAHYELKVKEVQEECGSGDKPKISVTVAGQDLLRMPKEEKLKVLYSSLTAFDMMDSLLSRMFIAPGLVAAASLNFVPELGWSKEALSAGAQSLGYPGIIHGMFSRGGAHLVHYFQTSSNVKLLETLKQLQAEQENKPIPPGQFAEKAIEARLKMTIPYISKWPQAIAIMSLPPNVPNALATLLTMVDDICYYAGDRSVDFNWYMRRIGIAAVYKATELYMIQDNSQEYEKTWIFLNKRLIEAVQLHDIISKSDIKSQSTKDTAQAVFVTARNILGLNWNSHTNPNKEARDFKVNDHIQA
ncbi:hypothetical protein NQ317_018066 [Molorchus minor]|uniref:Ubiquinone biosynthesis protein n=1 Tax=Molorchus minor TaxID=1323400 RepID=A0ABQ9JG45_9CUCU|nr:hypothetical protein NQ317_018066 [Molorchus minor]